MAKIGLIVDSTFTISEELAKKHDISIIPLTVFVDGQPHLDGTITIKQLEQAFLEDKDFYKLCDAINAQIFSTPCGPTMMGPNNRGDFNKIKSKLDTILSTLNYTE